MSENFHFSSLQNSKKERYAELLPQIQSLVSGESDLIANLANISSVLQSCMQVLWLGFYFVKDRELVLGPFQGPLACTRIAFGKGVCGTCWKEKKTIIVPDVENFPGHIACSSESKSEIVVPVILNEEVYLVIDADSNQLNAFDEDDQILLEGVGKIILRMLTKQK